MEPTTRKINCLTPSGVVAVIMAIVFVIFAFPGCSGGDDDSDCAATECPDAGPMTADADPAAPDDGPPDAAQNSDPCADYYWMEESWWDCNNHYSHCTVDVSLHPDDNSICLVKCEGAFWMDTSMLTIHMGTSPTEPAGIMYWSYSGEPPWDIVCTQQRT